MSRPVSARVRPAVFLRTLGLVAALAFAGAAAAAPAGHVPQVLLFGDSLIAGLGLSPDKAFPARLGAKLRALGITAKIINGGISGDTTAGGAARIDWQLATKPDLVVLEFGANDGFRSIDPAVMRLNFDRMIQKAMASGAKVVLMGMRAPINWGEKYQREFDALYPELARTYGITLYPFFLDGVVMDPQFNQPDGYHPNARGVDVIVDRVAPLIARLLRPDGGGRS